MVMDLRDIEPVAPNVCKATHTCMCMHTHILLFLLEMANMTVDAKKSHDLPSAILRPRRVDRAIQPESRDWGTDRRGCG